MIPFLAALQFLTISPTLIKRAFSEKELGQAAGYYPLVGALIGVLLYGANYGLALIVPDALRASLLVAWWIILSGALHMDGLLDAIDGILGGRTPEKRLEIMRDERVGAFGLSTGVILLLIKYSALSGFPQSAPMLILVPVLSRWGMTLAVFAYPYARPEGLGSAVKSHISWKQITIASLTALVSAWLCASWWGLLTLGITPLLVWGMASFVLRRIPGLTGDIYGAINELLEMILLLVLAGSIA